MRIPTEMVNAKQQVVDDSLHDVEACCADQSTTTNVSVRGAT